MRRLIKIHLSRVAIMMINIKMPKMNLGFLLYNNLMGRDLTVLITLPPLHKYPKKKNYKKSFEER